MLHGLHVNADCSCPIFEGTIRSPGSNSSGGDELLIAFTGAANLSGVVFQSTSTTSIERLNLFGAGHDIRFNASQLSPTGISTALTILGDSSGADIIRINNVTDNFDARAFSFDPSLWNAAGR